MVIHFIDIDVTVDHSCLEFLYIIGWEYQLWYIHEPYKSSLYVSVKEVAYGIVGHAYVNKKNYSRHVEKYVLYGYVFNELCRLRVVFTTHKCTKVSFFFSSKLAFIYLLQKKIMPGRLKYVWICLFLKQIWRDICHCQKLIAIKMINNFFFFLSYNVVFFYYFNYRPLGFCTNLMFRSYTTLNILD